MALICVRHFLNTSTYTSRKICWSNHKSGIFISAIRFRWCVHLNFRATIIDLIDWREFFFTSLCCFVCVWNQRYLAHCLNVCVKVCKGIARRITKYIFDGYLEQRAKYTKHRHSRQSIPIRNVYVFVCTNRLVLLWVIIFYDYWLAEIYKLWFGHIKQTEIANEFNDLWWLNSHYVVNLEKHKQCNRKWKINVYYDSWSSPTHNRFVYP